jgi:uncharacterized protein (TIGR02996 family)
VNTHDALLAAVHHNSSDATPKLVLADYLEENGHAGAHLLRAAGEMQQRGEWANLGPLLHRHSDQLSHHYLSPPQVIEDGYERHLIWTHHASRLRPPPLSAPMYLDVYHYADDSNLRFDDKDVLPSVSYIVPVHSKQHLDHLTSDWPQTPENAEFIRGLRPLLPDTHDEADRYSRCYGQLLSSVGEGAAL